MTHYIVVETKPELEFWTNTGKQEAYAKSRQAYREEHNLPGPLLGYGGRGGSLTNKLSMTNPKGVKGD